MIIPGEHVFTKRRPVITRRNLPLTWLCLLVVYARSSSKYQGGHRPGESALGVEVPRQEWKRNQRRSAAHPVAWPCGQAIHAETLNHDTAMSSYTPEALRLLTVKEAAQRLAVCKRTLERLIAAKKFPRPVKIGRATRIPEHYVQIYIGKLLTRSRTAA